MVIGVWVVVWSFTEGQDTLALGAREHTDLHNEFTEFRDAVLASRDTNPVIQFTYQLGEWFTSAVEWLQRMISIPDFPRPVPQIGWIGVAAVATWVGLAVAGWRIAILVAASFFSFGLFGYWSDSIDLLIITFVSVTVAILIGMPLAVLLGTTNRAGASILNTILDIFQTMPSFVYLLPIVLFFGIGASAAVVCTLIYALPPLIRIAGHGIRSVSDHDHRGDRLGRADELAAPAQGAAADGAQDDRGGRQPDDHGGTVDGHDRGVRRRSGPRPAGALGAVQERRRRRLRARHADRGDGGHARPVHHCRERGLREGRTRRHRPPQAADRAGGRRGPRRRGAVGVPRLLRTGGVPRERARGRRSPMP